MEHCTNVSSLFNNTNAIALGMNPMDIGMACVNLDDSLSTISCNEQLKKLAEHYDLPTDILLPWLHDLKHNFSQKITGCNTRAPLSFENKGKTQSGRNINFQWSISFLSDNQALCFVRDILWRQKYKDQWTLFDRIINSSHSSVVVTDSSNRIVIANKRFEDISGYAISEVLGKDPGTFGSDRQDKTFYKNLWAGLLKDGYWSGLLWNKRKDGREYPEQKTIYTVTNEAGQVTHYFSSGEPVLYNEQPHFAESVSHGQANSILGQESLIAMLNNSAEKQSQPIAIFYLGIDKMGKLNRYGGMALGDHVLRETLNRLVESFSPGGLIARSVGDEFIVAAPHINTADQAASVANSLLCTLQSSVEYQSIDWRFTVSIGVSLMGQEERPREAIELAHIAMHHAKDSGGNCVQFFDTGTQQEAKESILIEHALVNVLENNELYLNYQPIIDTQTNDLVCAEALIRWNSKQFGFVPPDRFIPIAEHCGMINKIGQWVFEEVCRQMNEWGESYQGSVAINLSAHQLQYGGLAEQLLSILDKYKIPVERIALEITETAMIHDAQSAVSVVRDLKAAGFLLSIDDFGTGYSSLSYLTGFHLDKLKVDRCFVQKMIEQPQEELVTKAIIQLAKSLGMKVVAEGVENRDQQLALSELGCDYLQGYLISKPLPPYEFNFLLNNLSAKVPA